MQRLHVSDASSIPASHFYSSEETSSQIYVEWYDIVRNESWKLKAFVIDVGRGSQSLLREVLRHAVDCAVTMEHYSRSDFVRSMDYSRYPARLPTIAFGVCVLVCDSMRRELERCPMYCSIERAMIVLEILIEAERPNPQRASLATLAPS